jgi:hypothetical protein
MTGASEDAEGQMTVVEEGFQMSVDDSHAAASAGLSTCTPRLNSPTRILVADLSTLSTLRKFSVVALGPPILKIHTVGRCGWYPEWQQTQYPGCKLIALPAFFAQHKALVSHPSCTLSQFIAASDEVCEQYEAIMQREFVAKLEADRDAVVGKAAAEARCYERSKKSADEDQTADAAAAFRKNAALDPQGLQTDHGMNVQFAMFKEAMSQQRDDMQKYFENMQGDFHVKVASCLCELCPETMHMLCNAGGKSIRQVEEALLREITLRNREGLAAFEPFIP